MFDSSSKQQEPLASFPLFQSSAGLEEVRTKVGEVFTPHSLKVLGRGPALKANMNHLALLNTSVSTLEYGTKVRIDSNAQFDEFALLMLPLTSSMHIACGDEELNTSPNLGAIVDSASQPSMLWAEGCSQLIVQINRKALESMCEALLGHPVKDHIKFNLGLNLESATKSTCKSLISMLYTNPFLSSISSISNLVVKQTEELLMSSLLLEQPHQYLQAILHPSKLLTPHFVKMAEEYMTNNASEPISLKDVALYCGVSLRSLHTGFQQYRGTTPKAFLRGIRMNSVRNELITARLNRKQESVTRVAFSWGFTHMSHFAASYFEKFNELPSETLKGR